MSDTVTKQIQGVCDGVMMKSGDWMEFHINIGRQYPVKLSTKQPDIQAKARAAGEMQAVWTFNETDGNPNPNKPGTFYKNRYLSDVEVGAVLSEEAQQQQDGGGGPARTGAPSGGRSDSERISIERQTLVKDSMHLYPIEGEDKITTADQYFALLTRLDTFMASARAVPAPAASPPASQPEPAVTPNSPDDPDDDIPF